MTNYIKYEEVSGEVSVSYTMYFTDHGELEHTHLIETVGEIVKAKLVGFEELPEGIKNLIPIR